MTFLDAYLRFAPVVVLAALVVVGGAAGLRRVPRRGRTLGTCVWLGAHAAAAATGLGGLVLGNVLVLGSAVGGAVWIGHRAGSRGALITLALAASVVDIVSFSTGPTRWLLDAGGAGGRGVIRYLAVSVPLDSGVVPVVGAGDLLLLGSFYVGLVALGHRAWVSAAVLCAGLLAALAVGLARGGVFGIPFMAVGVVALAALGGTDSSSVADASEGR